ncbi:leishmanolysin-related zinc metalloendopeptidase [Gemmatimonas sp.]
MSAFPRAFLTTAWAALGLAVLAACGSGDTPTAPAANVAPPTVPVSSVAFDIQFRFVGTGASPAVRESFLRAAARWREVIVADIGTTRLNASAGACRDWMPAVNESVNDLLVFVYVAPFDGPERLVAQASPCFVNAQSKLPLVGYVELDAHDADSLLARRLLDDVVLHEVGHVLGIGTLWNHKRSLLEGAGSDNPYFTGANARAAFDAVGGALFAGSVVPVENNGQSGTRDVHWRHSVFGAELMQGFVEPGGMPLSRVTIASLADLGYTVSFAHADPFSLMAALRMGSASEARHADLGHDVGVGPIVEVGGVRR